jgi:hypothetical protein
MIVTFFVQRINLNHVDANALTITNVLEHCSSAGARSLTLCMNVIQIPKPALRIFALYQVVDE